MERLVTSRVLPAMADLLRHLPVVRRDPLEALDLLANRSGYHCHRNIEFDRATGLCLDVYSPTRLGGPPPPAVVFFHGGRWSYGRKEEYRFVAQALVSRGHVVAVCDYRKYPDAIFPTFIEDAASALAWALDHLQEFGADPSRVFAMGHSAGAHIAALAVLDRRYGEAIGAELDRLAGLALLSCPLDFFPIRGDDLRKIFGPEHLHEDTQPIRFVRKDAPSLLLLHGRRDRTVGPRGSARMASAVRESGGRVRTILYGHLAHTDIVAALSDRVGFLFGPVLDDVTRFFAATADRRPPARTDRAAEVRQA